MHRHEDDRRVIIDWAQGEFKSAKVLIAKHGCVVGDHYHLRKDETFFLLKGRASNAVVGDDVQVDVKAPQEWNVPRGTYHRFELDEGSILLGTASERYDPEDEVKGKPA